MSTLLAKLIIPECGQPTYEPFDLGAGTWRFPCGLSVPDRVVQEGLDNPGCLTAVHTNHHEHMVDSMPWQIVGAINIDDSGYQVSFSCNCK